MELEALGCTQFGGERREDSSVPFSVAMDLTREEVRAVGPGLWDLQAVEELESGVLE